MGQHMRRAGQRAIARGVEVWYRKRVFVRVTGEAVMGDRRCECESIAPRGRGGRRTRTDGSWWADERGTHCEKEPPTLRE